MISNDKNFIFFHVPKNAGTTIKQEIKPYIRKGDSGFPFGDQGLLSGVMARHIGYAFGLWYDEIHRKKQLHLSQDNWQDYFKFGFTRNPWDRAVSNWLFVDRRIPTPQGKRFPKLADYLEALPFETGTADSYHAMEQWRHLCDPNGNLLTNYLGKVETLEQDFDTICAVIKHEPQPLRRMRKTDRTHYHDYYDDYTKELVAKYYAKDIEMFNYEY